MEYFIQSLNRLAPERAKQHYELANSIYALMSEGKVEEAMVCLEGLYEQAWQAGFELGDD